MNIYIVIYIYTYAYAMCALCAMCLSCVPVMCVSLHFLLRSLKVKVFRSVAHRLVLTPEHCSSSGCGAVKISFRDWNCCFVRRR